MDRMVLFVAFLILMAAFSGGAWAQTPPTEAPTGDDPCFTAVLDNLLPCVDFLDPDGNQTKPSKECCKGLEDFLKRNRTCITFLINVKPDDFPVPVDQRKALNLPGVCSASIPQLDHCFLHFIFSFYSLSLCSSAKASIILIPTISLIYNRDIS
ncbi:unnamed protein product [Spirodela intermedia]|uniref:Bifunctional inhibitor/plant lipid transfer protein/seed storage helical domain-containing protein n=1 Tax=Spirodela intermedia TaxID=51605 RepID=A0A7I8K4B1_SPIIN|nr:unnamed protein product [Spirodela intermedia]